MARGRKPTIPEAVRDYVREARYRRNLSHRAICAELAGRGIKLSVGACNEIAPGSIAGVKAPAKASAPAQGAPARGEGAAVSDAGPPPPLEPPPKPNDDTDIAALDRWIAETEELAKQAKLDKNLAAFASLQRVLKGAVESRRKMRPPAAPNPDDNPDMMRLGKLAADRLHKLIDDALREAG